MIGKWPISKNYIWPLSSPSPHSSCGTFASLSLLPPEDDDHEDDHGDGDEDHDEGDHDHGDDDNDDIDHNHDNGNPLSICFLSFSREDK